MSGGDIGHARQFEVPCPRILFGNRAFADVVKEDEAVLGGFSSRLTGVLVRGDSHRHTQGEDRPRGAGERD